jgi:uncharacterized glyoxalase superfamily protein PhnB
MTEPISTDIMPTLRYRDCDAAVDWLVDVLGCERHFINRSDTGAIGHGELRYGTGMMMVGSYPDQVSGDLPDLDLGNASTYLINDNDTIVEDTFKRAVSAGAPVIQEFRHQPYGGSSCTVRDPEGNYWTIGSYRPTAQ